MAMIEESVGAIIYDDEDRFLVVQSEEGVWGFPKGGIRSGERMLDAVLREVRDGVGIEIDVLPISRSLRYPKADGGSRVVTYSLASKSRGEVRLSDAVRAFLWLYGSDAANIIRDDDVRQMFCEILDEHDG